MDIQLEYHRPMDIERRSMEIITQELKQQGIAFNAETAHIIRRVIHTTADFEYATSLYFSPGAQEIGRRALQQGTPIVTDTRMAQAGINKAAVERFGSQVYCFMSDADVAERAKAEGVTRAVASMDKAAEVAPGAVFVVGNAPTALIRLCQLMEEGKVYPALVVGVPVGFVNVVEAKELLIYTGVPCIVARGRKGGSNVGAAICNAMLYEGMDRG